MYYLLTSNYTQVFLEEAKVSIYLPPEINPTLPIECSNIYRFTYTDSNPPTCTYDSTSNRIDTVNFNTPIFLFDW
jgi:hypothetical protein